MMDATSIGSGSCSFDLEANSCSDVVKPKVVESGCPHRLVAGGRRAFRLRMRSIIDEVARYCRSQLRVATADAESVTSWIPLFSGPSGL